MVGEIKICDVVRTFVNPDPREADVVALNGLSLDIKPGKFVSLIGPSGCGKTTLLRLIAGLDAPTRGALLLDEVVIDRPHYERGFVFQSANLFPWLNIRENIAFGLRARHEYREKKETVDELIELVGLKGFEKSFPHQLSGGMCQRVSLARALVGHPKVLLMDEPLGALDAFTRMNMQDEILRIWSEHNMTVVMVTHDVDEAIYLSDQVVVMSPRPAKIETIIDIEMTRPRARNQDDFIRYRTEILEILNFGGEIKTPDYYL
ncbi:MAG: transporter related protein [Oscillospiraceae bacterium]|nr:transporter related protein [Oscillospiraceae bacterium]